MIEKSDKHPAEIQPAESESVTALTLLATLRRLGVFLRAVDGKLEYRAKQGIVTENMRLALERHKDEIITILRSASPQPLSLAATGTSGNVLESAPLSFEQARVWFLEQVDTGAVVHNLVTAVILLGKLDVEVLYRCFDDIVRRHQILRTTYEVVNGVPMQMVRAAHNLERVVVDMGSLHESLQHRECIHISRKMQARSFDLAGDLMLRVIIARCGVDRHALFVSRHHIASDGSSFAILIRELNILYARYWGNIAPELLIPKIQYTQYAEWQRSLQTEKAGIEYWREQLNNIPACFRLPSDIPDVKLDRKKRSSFAFTLEAEQVINLWKFSAMHSVTRFAVTLAAFQAAIAWRTGETDIIVGTDISTRDSPELDELIGLFVNRLIVRNKICSELTFSDLSRQVHRGLIVAYEHRQVPFDRIVEVINPKRELGVAPFFSIMFGFHNNRHEKFMLPGISHVSLIEAPNVASQMDLSVYLTDVDDILVGEVIYDAGRFRERSVRTLIDAFSKILKLGLAEPSSRLEEYYAVIENQREKYESRERSAFRDALRTSWFHG